MVKKKKKKKKKKIQNGNSKWGEKLKQPMTTRGGMWLKTLNATFPTRLNREII